jgi:hypothetical protein
VFKSIVRGVVALVFGSALAISALVLWYFATVMTAWLFFEVL